MMYARPIHKESVCFCCGRTIPAIAPVVIVDGAHYLRPRVFCRRCYKDAYWRDMLEGVTVQVGPSTATRAILSNR